MLWAVEGRKMEVFDAQTLTKGMLYLIINRSVSLAGLEIKWMQMWEFQLCLRWNHMKVAFSGLVATIYRFTKNVESKIVTTVWEFLNGQNWFHVKFEWQEHSVEKREILSHQKTFRQITSFSNLFSKTITYTKYLPKMSEREFP